MADILNVDDIVHYDKHAGHGIEWEGKLYYVLKLADIVLVE
jgi:co-chaperonin GroES (HSP10)